MEAERSVPILLLTISAEEKSLQGWDPGLAASLTQSCTREARRGMFGDADILRDYN